MLVKIAEIGNNNPPGQIEFCQETVQAISAWMADNPVIEDENSARKAKLLVDRAKSALKDLESERDLKVRPLNQQVKAVNDLYRPARDELDSTLTLILGRVNDYIKKEEAKRFAAAREAQRKLDEAVRAAEEAEQRAREAEEDAKSGVVVDVVTAAHEAERAFKAFTKAEREAARAEKDAHVKIGGGFNRALSTRTKEELILVDAMAAIQDIGFTERLIDAILSEARAFRQIHNRLPEGVKSEKRKEL